MDFPTLTEDEQNAMYASLEPQEADQEPEAPAPEPEARDKPKKQEKQSKPSKKAATTPSPAPAPEPKPAPEQPQEHDDDHHEEPKPEPKQVVPTAPKAPEAQHNDTFARLRYEASEEKRRREALEREIAEMRGGKKAPEIPKPEENLGGYLQATVGTIQEKLARFEEWQTAQDRQATERNQLTSAIREMNTIESGYTAVAPEYPQAANHLRGMMATSIKMLNPDITPEDLAQQTMKQYLTIAGNAYQQGQNPAEAIYGRALAVGWRPGSSDQPSQAQTPAQRGPDLDVIAANKRRSAGTAGAGGGASNPVSLESALKMPNGEFSRLDPEKTKALMYGHLS